MNKLFGKSKRGTSRENIFVQLFAFSNGKTFTCKVSWKVECSEVPKIFKVPVKSQPLLMNLKMSRSSAKGKTLIGKAIRNKRVHTRFVSSWKYSSSVPATMNGICHLFKKPQVMFHSTNMNRTFLTRSMKISLPIL